MTLDELVAHLRVSILRDTQKPSLWSDDELTLYLNEAHDQFARRTHCLADEESDFTFLQTEPGVALYALDPVVVFVSDILHEDGLPVRKLGGGRLRSTAQGRPSRYNTDSAVRSLRLYPTPDAVYTLDLLVARKPLARLANGADEPEIDEDFHLSLCEWAAYRALRNNDTDGMNVVEAAKFRESWELAVREGKRAVMRYRASPRQLNNWTGK